MKPLRVLSILALAGFFCEAPSYPAVTADVGNDRIILRNDYVERVLTKDGNVWRTTLFARADGSDRLDVTSDEFSVLLMDGNALTITDYIADVLPDVSDIDGGKAVRIEYEPGPGLPEGAPEAVFIRYSLGEEPYLRKAITLSMAEGGAVDTLQVERFRTGSRCDRGGRGQPVFIGDSWFVGLEYPGSETAQDNGLVTLAHFPGLAKRDESSGEWLIRSKTAVAGVGQPGDLLELAFSDYIDTIRTQSRSFLHYNSWYDWRGNELTLDNLVATFEGFKKNLLDPYALKMDAFVPDDGWQEPDSIWVPKADLYPDGFGALRDALEARGTRLGLWMPLNGTNLNTDWGEEQGYEKSDQGGFYCLAGPNYNAAIRDTTKRLITQGNLAYYKHDFNHLRCTAPDHGHLPDDRHGHEANLDAELDLLAYERELAPDIFLNITSFVWHSPWWLQHADSIWMAASDFGYDTTWPQLSPREWAMSYRDTHFYKLYQEQRDLVPVSAMMTHGIIHGKYCELGGDQETLREWSDYVVMYYARGVQLKELYITPDMMSPDRWKVLGCATRWAIANRDVLDNVVMKGGDPRKGEPYGYVHWKGDAGIIALRNPDAVPQTIEIPFDKSVRYRGEPGRPFRARVIYPYVEPLPDQYTSGAPLRLTVPACSVLLVDLEPGQAPETKPAEVPTLSGAYAQIISFPTGGVTLETHVQVPDEEMQRCDLYMLLRGASADLDFGEVWAQGSQIEPRTARGPEWLLSSVDLRPYRGQDVEIAAAIVEPEGPFSSGDITVSAWIAADRQVEAPAGPNEGLPFAISQNHRRETVELVRDASAKRRERPSVHVTAADLKAIKAAKVRIRVFDVNSEPQYRDKFIFLNGEKLMRVPANEEVLSAWEEHTVDLEPDQFGLIRLRNTFELNNAGGDFYKFSRLALAVQLADGTWAQSTSDDTVHTSIADWAYAEGKVFEGDTSGPIEVSFP